LPGKFIVLDGPDGCGKSTHARLLSRWLRSKGYRVLLTDEPTNSEFGKIIKRSLKGKISLPRKAEAALFTLDRAWHVSRVIVPALKSGAVVISERYVYSTLAYQPARGVPLKWVKKLSGCMPRPDLTIILDVPTAETMKRVKAKGPDLFEQCLNFQRKVRENYLRLARERKLPVINTSKPKEEVQGRIRSLVARLLGIN